METPTFALTLWTLAFLLAIRGCIQIARDPWLSSLVASLKIEQRALQSVVALLQEFEEMLSAGILPDAESWKRLAQLKAPWGRLTYDSVQELRAQGSAILPTLGRLRCLAEAHRESLLQAKAKSSQALAQALVAGVMVPVFGGVLYLLLPGISEHFWLWLLVCLVGLLFSLAAAIWMLAMTDAARWGGLKKDERSWILSIQCTGERFLALTRGGTPADLAWSRAMEFLTQSAPWLAHEWGCNIWTNGKEANATQGPAARKSILNLGPAIRHAIQVSVMDGKPCAERVETALKAFRQDLEGSVERELSLLSTRVLKPVFLLIAPAIFGILGVGLWLTWLNASSGGAFEF